MEKYRLFFLEDPLPPEENDHFKLLRQSTSTPIAMGELFNTQHEYVPLIANRLIDFIRIHLSQIGGLSMARKSRRSPNSSVSRPRGMVRATRRPSDTRRRCALELASYNFGIHEGYVFPAETQEVFPGCPQTCDGMMWANESPGFGIDVDEKLAAKFPYPPGPTFDYNWGTMRRRDGTVIRP